jgi:hypothetical protein
MFLCATRTPDLIVATIEAECGRSSEYRMKKTKKRRHTGLKILLFLILLVAILFIDSNMRIAVDEYPLYYKNLPASFDGFRIAQLSDIHAADFGNGNMRLVDAVKKAHIWAMR